MNEGLQHGDDGELSGVQDEIRHHSVHRVDHPVPRPTRRSIDVDELVAWMLFMTALIVVVYIFMY
jgi:hypothetical protein